MNTESEKLELLQLVLNTDSPEILKKAKALLTKHAQKSDTEHLLSTRANKEHILSSINQLNEGKGKAIKTADLWK